MVILFNLRFPRVAVVELALAGAILFAAYVGVVATHLPTFSPHPITTTAAALAFAIAQLIAISSFGLLWRGRSEPATKLAAKFALSLLLGTVICYAAFAALPETAFYRESIPDALLLSAAGLLGVRLLLASGLQHQMLTHRVLVLGAGIDAAAVERAFRSSPEAGVTLVGFYPIDASTAKVVSPDRVLSNATPLETTVRRLGVHEVIVAVREQRGGSLPVSQLLNCRLRGVRITDLSGFFERMTGEVPVDSLKASWLIYGEGFRQDWARRTMKRSFDIVASALLLLLAAPVMLAAAVAIFFESGQPIIFRQERVGLGGRTFMLLKFRSMCSDAESDGVPQWARRGDPRVTRVGRWLRRCRIDELPQIFNVLNGHMSFVGPRPERPYFVDRLSERVPFYGARHTVKPGVTGWAQVSYSYGASEEDAVKKLQYDLYYVKNHTLALDLVILFKTVEVVLRGEGVR
jgi:sugar transferase (PEP-CTERM system associated)